MFRYYYKCISEQFEWTLYINPLLVLVLLLYKSPTQIESKSSKSVAFNESVDSPHKFAH